MDAKNAESEAPTTTRSSRPRSGSAFAFGRALAGAGAQAPKPAAGPAARSTSGPAPAAAARSGPATPTREVPGARGPALAPAVGPGQPLTDHQFSAWYAALPTDTGFTSLLVRSLLQHAELQTCSLATDTQAAAMRAEAERLTQEGEIHKAQRKVCEVALYSLATRGPEHPESVRAVYKVVQSMDQTDKLNAGILGWLLPRTVEQHGVAHPDTRWLVVQAAMHLGVSSDPRLHTRLSRLTMDIARRLPGGLGWGTAVLAPVPDEEAYTRHAIMQQEAYELFEQGHYKLAVDLMKRCVAYFEPLGPHWLGSQRLARCHFLLGPAILEVEGAAASELSLRDGKKRMQRELGMTHPETLNVTWAYAETLMRQGRHEASLSLLMKTHRQRQEVLGRYHHKVLESQFSIASQLARLGRGDQGLEAYEAAFTSAMKLQGCRSSLTEVILNGYWRTLRRVKGAEGAEALKQRAAELGCDTSVCASIDEYIAQREELCRRRAAR